MGVFSWFSKSGPTDYETLLARLSTDIDEAKIHLSEIRLRERRAALLINAYGVAVWGIWTGLWWIGGIPWGLIGCSSEDVEGRVAGAAGVAIGPLFIWGLNRLLRFYYTRQTVAEEKNLRKLLSEQRKQVEAIKKATNYDSTRKLIERYDDERGPNMQMQVNQSAPVTPNRKATGSPASKRKGQPQPQELIGTPRAPGHLVGAGGTPGPGTPVVVPEGLTVEQATALQQMQYIQPVLPTPEKRWYDRVADSILGEDPSQASQSKFALVCGECFRHNGLVGSKYEWERMQWICPRCNHLNPSPLSRQKAESSSQSSSLPAPNANPIPPSPLTPSHLPRIAPSPRPRRNINIGEKGTPRSSRLGKEVFSASEGEEGEGEGGGENETEGYNMEVDDDK